MNLIRLISGEAYKGTRNYLDTQRTYEIIKTLILYGISLSLLAAGWITTKTRLNLLTIVAVLGCLPASKSLVSVIMFCRYHSLSRKAAGEIEKHGQKLTCLYDMVFTGREKTYAIGHLAIKGNTICGFSEKPDFDQKAFNAHLEVLLKNDSYSNVSIYVFTNLQKYLDRLDQMEVLACDEKNTAGIAESLKSVCL